MGACNNPPTNFLQVGWFTTPICSRVQYLPLLTTTISQFTSNGENLGSSPIFTTNHYYWVVRGGYRRVFCQYLKIQKKYETNTTQKYKIRTAGFGKYNWLVLYFFVFWFLISKSEHGVGSLAYFWICLFFVFCIFKILGSYVFCIFEIVDSYFFVFCIFEQLHSYFLYFFVCFSYFFCIKKNTNKIQKHTLCICVFFWYFSITSKNAICIFVLFLHFSSPSQIALCPFVFFAFFRHAVKEQNRESINVCCIFLLLIILPCSVLYFFCNLELYFLYFFVFLMITGFTVCSKPGTTQHY